MSRLLLPTARPENVGSTLLLSFWPWTLGSYQMPIVT
ncbi:MAG: hypothetical protein QOJ56_1578 [Mycobacterium sp.]|jgi:hypothetical protein|nr:hypothetical protein [Mycobacterium sp.]